MEDVGVPYIQQRIDNLIRERDNIVAKLQRPNVPPGKRDSLNYQLVRIKAILKDRRP